MRRLPRRGIGDELRCGAQESVFIVPGVVAPKDLDPVPDLSGCRRNFRRNVRELAGAGSHTLVRTRTAVNVMKALKVKSMSAPYVSRFRS